MRQGGRNSELREEQKAETLRQLVDLFEKSAQTARDCMRQFMEILEKLERV